VAWSFHGAPGLAYPIVGNDGIIYVSGLGAGVLYAIRHDGQQIWSLPIDVVGAPAQSADGTIYVSSDQSLVAVSTAGAILWRAALGANAAPSPLIGSDGTIYVGSDGGSFFAFASDGSERWHTSSIDEFWAAPAQGGDGAVYIGTNINYGRENGFPQTLYALDPSGATRWQFTANADLQSPVLGAGDEVYVRTGGAQIIAVSSPGEQSWSSPVDIYNDGAPAVGPDGTIYVASGSANLSALSPEGSVRWVFSSEPTLCDMCSPSVDAEGTVYLSSFGPEVFAIGGDGTERWAFSLPDEQSSHTAQRDAIAIGGDGTLYVGSDDGTLWALTD